MVHCFQDIAFTPSVRRQQEEAGSRTAYARFEAGPPRNDRLGPAEAAFLAERDSFYMASQSETGWPYVQHRGGPPGFLTALNDQTLGFADYRGNRQYITLGNLDGNDRVCLFLMDYRNRRRLKLYGHAGVRDLSADPDLAARLTALGGPGVPERAMVIRVAGFDWNCPQHIQPRFTEPEIRQAVQPLMDRIAELEAALAAARSTGARGAAAG